MQRFNAISLATSFYNCALHSELRFVLIVDGKVNFWCLSGLSC